MKEEFVHTRNSDWSTEEKKIINEVTEFIGNPITGDPVTEIGRYIAQISGVKYLLIGRFIPPEKEKVQTLCFFNYTQQLDDFIYDLRNTPCHEVYWQRMCYFPSGVREKFPKDADLVIMGVDSYMGSALRDYSGESIGLIVLLNDKTIENPGLIDHLLTLVSPALERNLIE